jgi:hypothetical protein
MVAVPGVLVFLVAMFGCVSESPQAPVDAKALIAVSAPQVPDDVQRSFHADLAGSNEAAPNNSEATGIARFQVVENGAGLHHSLAVTDLDNLIQAHIHLGPVGVNGPVVAFLYGPNPISGSVTGKISKGVIRAGNLVGPLAGMPLQNLLDMLRSGGAYVNVHTTAFPGGEIRGQIE